jgi:AraC-like DNA-binding protein
MAGDQPDVASRHRVSPRYLQLLFESGGGTFSEYVVEQRLARACRMLTETKFADWTIGAIAFEAGFSNLSYFNRTFRRLYGETPSDVRAKAQSEEQGENSENPQFGEPTQPDYASDILLARFMIRTTSDMIRRRQPRGRCCRARGMA